MSERELYKLKRRLVDHCDLFSENYVQSMEGAEVRRCYEQSLVRLIIKVNFLRRHNSKSELRRLRRNRTRRTY